LTAVEFDAVTYKYPGAARPALRSVSLSIEPGEFCVVAGLSGCGKSTLLRAAAGLAPRFFGGEIDGRVRVNGVDTRDASVAQIGQHAGTVLQDPETQVVMATVRAEIALALENRGLPRAEVARAVEETALAVGVADLLDRSTAELSGGELQRVALAAALAPRPALVLLDEPTSQLDPVAGDELIWQLRRLNQESDTAVLLVEHRLERCLAAADRVVALDDGELVCDADPQGFLRWAAKAAPRLMTPGARLFAAAGIEPLPAGVKQARATLRREGLSPAAATAEGSPAPRPAGPCALELKGVWHELRDGPVLLRNVDLKVAPGEAVALMGRNGAGKSTLLRHCAGLEEPTRGAVRSGGRVALLMQNPSDYLLHERVADEAPHAALELVSLAGLADRNPRDLSGGERQRLALAIVLAGGEAPAVIALDEPTRGMDAAAKDALAAWLLARCSAGCAVLVATHDTEFAARFAARTVLLARGRVIADGPTGATLARGRWFTTETARILGGARDALLPEDGARVIRRADAVSAASEAPA